MCLAMSLKVVYVICSLFCTTKYFQELCLTKNTNFLFLQFGWFFNLDKLCASFQVVQHGYKLFQMSTCCFDQESRWMSLSFKILTTEGTKTGTIYHVMVY